MSVCLVFQLSNTGSFFFFLSFSTSASDAGSHYPAFFFPYPRVFFLVLLMENVEHTCPQNECNDAIAHFIRICLGFNEDVLLAAERKLWPVWPLFSALPWSFVLFFLVSFFYSVLLSWLVSRCLFVIIFFFFLPMRLYLDIRSSRAWCLCAPYVMQAWRMWEQMEVPPFFFFFFVSFRYTPSISLLLFFFFL